MQRRTLKIFLYLFLFNHSVYSQTPKEVFIKLTDPLKEINATGDSLKYIIGSTCKKCLIKINNQAVKVFPTGAFVYEAKLSEGQNDYNIEASLSKDKSINKQIQFNLKKPVKEESVKTFSIEKIQTFPKGDLMLLPGDEIDFSVKALTACNLEVLGKKLYELPDSVTKGIKGIYQGKYIIQTTDSFMFENLPIKMTSSDNKVLLKETTAQFTVMQPTMPDIYITKGRLSHLVYGIGDDRLGGAKIGYIDSLIHLKIIGKVGNDYKVRLTKNRMAYIPSELVNPMPLGTFEPNSLTGKIIGYGDSLYDYVSIQLFEKLPYQSFQLTDPSKIVVDIFGATNNTNWINQLESLREITKIEYEQIEDGIFRVTLSLKHHQHWGHSIFYKGTILTIKVKQQPKILSLPHLTIAIDAGHGGNNSGAVGPTGVAEKSITLSIALKLKELLEKEGATIIMTRNTEIFFDNKQRILFYRDSTPDLLLSIHLNSANDPINISGTSTFYRYEGFRPLSHAIYKQMLELGLKEYGNNGSFNFMLNSPTEYPNALIETLFLSNPEEEMKILDEGFQYKVAEKITHGIKDFLESCH